MGRKNAVFLMLIFAALLHSGCSSSLEIKQSLFGANGERFDVESIAEQTEEALSAYPTRFILPVSEGKVSLERAFYFLKTYTSGNKFGVPGLADREVLLTNEGSTDRTFTGFQGCY